MVSVYECIMYIYVCVYTYEPMYVCTYQVLLHVYVLYHPVHLYIMVCCNAYTPIVASLRMYVVFALS